MKEEIQNITERLQGDRIIWMVVIILFVFSMLAVYSASGSLAFKYTNGDTSHYLWKQVMSAIGGILLMYFAHLINYKYYSRIAQVLWILSIPLLFYTMFFGAKINDASRWIKLPLIGWTFQTSDMAKLALIMFLARLLTQKQEQITDFKKSVLPMLIVVIIPVVMIAKDNLSTALILFFTSVFIMFIGRVSLKHLMLLFAGSVCVLGIFLLSLFKLPDSMLIGRMATWKSRVETHFIHKDDPDDSYQSLQANIAIAKGGFLPNGPGNSTQKNFLPEAYSDFIYAIIIEEYGLIGGVFVILLYLVFLYRCIRIVVRAPKAFGAFLAVGLGVSLVLQAMINMAVAVGLFPVTGVTLPLVSMGGSSVVFTSLAFGIVLSVSRNIELQKGEENLAVA
ncbi:MAG: FtsW/RodA/SpoVE family cell cycle protein [Chitinophagales bacterium]|nr:FtsW/RodA/SpoVE family cell cycle protein [Chitinophagales bacterium]